MMKLNSNFSTSHILKNEWQTIIKNKNKCGIKERKNNDIEEM